MSSSDKVQTAVPTSSDEPSQDHASSDQPPQGQTSSDQPPQDQTSSDQPPQGQTSSDQPPQDQTSSVQSPQDRASSDQSPQDHTSSDQSPQDQTSSDQPPQDQMPSDQLPQDQTSSDQSPQGHTLSDQSPQDQTSSDQSPQDQTSSDQSSQERTGKMLREENEGSPKDTTSSTMPSNFASNSPRAQGAETTLSPLSKDFTPTPSLESASKERFYLDISTLPFHLFSEIYLTKRITIGGKDQNLTFDYSFDDAVFRHANQIQVRAYLVSDGYHTWPPYQAASPNRQTDKSQRPENRATNDVTPPPSHRWETNKTKTHSPYVATSCPEGHTDKSLASRVQPDDIPPENRAIDNTLASSPPESRRKGGVRSASGKHFLKRSRPVHLSLHEGRHSKSGERTDLDEDTIAPDEIQPREWHDPEYRQMEERKMQEYKRKKESQSAASGDKDKHFHGKFKRPLPPVCQTTDDFFDVVNDKDKEGDKKNKHHWTNIAASVDNSVSQKSDQTSASVNAELQNDTVQRLNINKNKHVPDENIISSDWSTSVPSSVHTQRNRNQLLPTVPGQGDTDLDETNSYQIAGGPVVMHSLKRKATSDTEDEQKTDILSPHSSNKRCRFSDDGNNNNDSLSASSSDGKPWLTSTQASSSHQFKSAWSIDMDLNTEVMQIWQLDYLLGSFIQNRNPPREQIKDMAVVSGLREDTIQAWFEERSNNIKAYSARKAGEEPRNPASVEQETPADLFIRSEVDVERDVAPESDEDTASETSTSEGLLYLKYSQYSGSSSGTPESVGDAGKFDVDSGEQGTVKGGSALLDLSKRNTQSAETLLPPPPHSDSHLRQRGIQQETRDDPQAPPSQPGSAQGTPSQASPTQQGSAQGTPSQASPSQPGSAQGTSSQASPCQPGSAQGTPSQETPSQPGSAQGAPSQTSPSQPGSAQGAPSQASPSQPGSAQGTPSQASPSQPGSAQGAPSQASPSQRGSVQDTSRQDLALDPEEALYIQEAIRRSLKDSHGPDPGNMDTE